MFEQLEQDHIYTYKQYTNEQLAEYCAYMKYVDKRKRCTDLLKELYNYSINGYKKYFTSIEENNLNKLIESNDFDNIELARQIILTKLNNG